MSMVTVKGHGKTFNLQLYLAEKSQTRKLFLFGLLFFMELWPFVVHVCSKHLKYSQISQMVQSLTASCIWISWFFLSLDSTE